MKFIDLAINQTFTAETYPECVGVKVKKFGGSCCTPPHNAKMICQKDGTPQETAVLFEDDQEVTPQPEEMTAEPSEIAKSEEILQQQVDIGTAERETYNRKGYKWSGPGPDPTVVAARKAAMNLGSGGNFGDAYLPGNSKRNVKGDEPGDNRGGKDSTKET
jgi:hypothetical protein